jgi:L-ascorbate metabolism protein UlaG (beta-lactamase superfamily)
MLIKYFGYNSFVIETKKNRILIDPGGSFYLPHFFRPIVPKEEWSTITHIIVTHGDPDHHWHTDRVQKKSNAELICSSEMAKTIDGRMFMLGPRNKGLKFIKSHGRISPVNDGETLETCGIAITGFKGMHGAIKGQIGPFNIHMTPGHGERIGKGEMVFQIDVEGKRLVNFGDTLLLEKEWENINNPDLIMIPIGGYTTMNDQEAVQLIKMIKPKIVIPCHYDCPAFFSKCKNFVDTAYFKAEAEKAGSKCVLLKPGEEFFFD